MIFTDRKITIRNGKSTINEPVILYRGDYEVSIKFTIMESKFRFKSGVNLVDSEKASNGQLAILTPYGGNVFSEIVKCEDGTVTFTLTKEMIDQLEEVGLYSFQIRLFDYYRESRVSIPPVEFGIEVREPVASEDHDNEVNNAIVGYSIAKVVDGLNEDVPDTFDSNGQYNKTNWKTGDRISQGKLNKIEDALDKINQNEKNDVTALDKRITNNYNVLENNKADVDYVNTKVNAVASGAPKGVYATLAELQHAKPNGDSNIYIVIEDGCWYYWKGSSWTKGGVYQSTGIADNSVLPRHINKGVRNINIYDEKYEINGYYIDTLTRILTADGSTSYARVPIEPNTKYYLGRDTVSTASINNGDIILFMDSEFNIIDTIHGSLIYVYNDIKNRRYGIIETLSNASYICFNTKIGAFDTIGKSYLAKVDDVGVSIKSLDELNVILKIFGSEISDHNCRNSLNDFVNSIKSLSNDIYKDNAIIFDDELCDTSAMIVSAKGWQRASVPVKENTDYSIWFSSEVYNSSRGHLLFLKDVDVVGFCNVNNIPKLQTDSKKTYIRISVPQGCNYISFTTKNPADTFNDTFNTIITEGTLTDYDFKPFIKEINNYSVFNPSNLESYLPTFELNLKEDLYINKVITNGFLYDNMGKMSGVSGWALADVPVTPSNTYYIHLPSENYNVNARGKIVLLNENKEIIKGIDNQDINMYIAGNYKWQIAETTEDTRFIGITVLHSKGQYDDREGTIILSREPQSTDADRYIEFINGFPIKAHAIDESIISNVGSLPLEGKKWVVIGDSLTERNSRATKFYHDYVSEETGCTVVNMGRSGTGYKSPYSFEPFYERVLTLPADTDIVTIFGSGNDLRHTLGTPSDTGTDTICGCMRQTFENLFSVMPGVKVGVVLPCPWGAYPPSVKDNKMALYCEALKEIAGQYSIPVLDLYHGSNLRPWDPTFRDLYYKNDGGNTVHPDQDGHKILANKFKMFIQSL